MEVLQVCVLQPKMAALHSLTTPCFPWSHVSHLEVNHMREFLSVSESNFYVDLVRLLSCKRDSVLFAVLSAGP